MKCIIYYKLTHLKILNMYVYIVCYIVIVKQLQTHFVCCFLSYMKTYINVK